jgi:hypothetical protein
MLEQFLALSRLLTGEAELNRDLAEANLTCIAGLPDSRLNEVLRAYEERVAGSVDPKASATKFLLNDSNLTLTTQQIIVLWFTGATFDSTGKLNSAGAAQYASALMWGSLGAHPPGYSKAYFGHWKYPAE